MMKRKEWVEYTTNLDWELSYVKKEQVYPELVASSHKVPSRAWENWEEPFKTTYQEYVHTQSSKDADVFAIRAALGKTEDFHTIDPVWLNALKLHSATFTLAEFAAVIGNLKAVRFAPHARWKNAALLGALDELRHTQIPLLIMSELVKVDGQFDWTHKFYHTDNWVAIAARHMVDEMLLINDPVEFAVATNFVFETGFTNLQFIGLSTLSHDVKDKMIEKMLSSIQSDEARHAQIGPPVLEALVKHNPEYAQYLVDKWFWRSWHLFAVVTGFAMDYFTPLKARKQSFKEFMEEWVLNQYLKTLDHYGLKKPWYWSTFMQSLENYHHMVYLSAYTYRATVWFDFVVPNEEERKWLRHKYPKTWEPFEQSWKRIAECWQESDPGNDFGVHGKSIVSFCDLCQIVLCEGTPEHNTAIVVNDQGQKHIFCSEPCRWIFQQEREKYKYHKNVVGRVLAGQAPANVIALIQKYFGLNYSNWGKDAYGGRYSWIKRKDAT